MSIVHMAGQWRPRPAATASYARRTQWHFDRDREFRARVLRSTSMIRPRWTRISKAGISKSAFKNRVRRKCRFTSLDNSLMVRDGCPRNLKRPKQINQNPKMLGQIESALPKLK
jgi:hypothetical protein